MLQQTQVATVVPYYLRFLERFPTLETLAVAGEEAVLASWAGLGYYSRARALHAGARRVLADHGGRIPDSPAALLRLPGIGPYTANAIASIAFRRRVPVVDGNVARVLCRLFGLRGDPRSQPLRRQLWELAARFVPRDDPGGFNSALMELGATVCSPARPQCGRCPVSAFCAARSEGCQEELPQLRRPPAPTSLQMAAALVARQDRVLLARRSLGGRWAGMWVFPLVELDSKDEPGEALRRHLRDALGVEVEPGRLRATVRHTVTRYRVTLTAYQCRLERGEPQPTGYAACEWIPRDELAEKALPSAHRRIARVLQQGHGEGDQLDLAYPD
jgi:A/G-specific adenine glycosylase